ncbi:MAG: ABC transporter permease, partial [Brevinema sp.]
MKNLGNQQEKNFFKRFLVEFRQYREYIICYSTALEKFRVANTSLGFIWWFLDPLLNMAIYIILVRFVFSQRDPNYPVFFFSAMLVWRYFSTSVLQGVNTIRASVPICREVYVPKFIFPLVTAFGGLYPLVISLGILTVMMVIFQVSFTIYLLYLPILLIVLFIFTTTCAMIVAHVGAFIKDFGN